jgi:hypothetical protein
MRLLPRPAFFRDLLMICCGFAAGAVCFYACLAKRWREEAGDYCMLRIDSLIIQGEYLHKHKWDAAIGSADRGLLGSMYIVDEDFPDHPGARYWVERVGKYASDYGLPLGPAEQAILERAKSKPEVTTRVFYRWY